MNLRWYTAQLQGLPPRSRQQLTQKLLRHLRRGVPPSRREWSRLIRRLLEPYDTQPLVRHPGKMPPKPRRQPDWVAEMIAATAKPSL